MQWRVSSPSFASRHHDFIIDKHLGQVIEPVWWERVSASEGLNSVRHRLSITSRDRPTVAPKASRF